MGKITRFKVGKETYYLDFVQDWSDNFGNLTNRSDSLPGQHGSYDQYGIGEVPAADGTLRVNFIATVDQADLMTAKLDVLRSISRWAKGKLFMQPYDSSENERWCNARIDNVSAPHSEKKNTHLWMRANATFSINDPHWYSQGTSAPLWREFKWGTGITYGGSAQYQAFNGLQTDLTLNVAEGNAPAQAKINLKLGTGETAQNITIQRLVNGQVVEQIALNEIFVENDKVLINVRKRSVKKNNIAAYANFTFLNNRWLRLIPGNNDIRVLCANAGDAGSIKISYRGTYA